MAKKAASKRAAPATTREPVDLARALVHAWRTNERMNQFLLEHLDERAWDLPPPLAKKGAGRTIAAIVAHVHNVRHMWLVVAMKGAAVPDKIDRKAITLAGARKALAASALAMEKLFETSIESGGRVKNSGLDVQGFLGYSIAHEAHHRGQIMMLARQLGHPFAQEANFGMWDWKNRAAEVAR